jgi:hypothetical protein
MRHGVVAVAAASVLAVGLGMMGHECAHVLAGTLAGGSPTLVTSTEVLGDFAALTPAGFILLGVSGSVLNLLLAMLGWWAFTRGPATAQLQLSAWLCFAVNGLLLTTKMMVEPIAGFGDWMTILRQFPDPALSRALVACLGTAGVAFMIRRSGPGLAKLVPAGDAPSRRREARRLLLIAAAASAALVLGGSVRSPTGLSRGVPLALGAGLSPFVPMLFTVRLVPRFPPPLPNGRNSSPTPWLLASAGVTFLMWFVFGPGVRL